MRVIRDYAHLAALSKAIEAARPGAAGRAMAAIAGLNLCCGIFVHENRNRSRKGVALGIPTEELCGRRR